MSSDIINDGYKNGKREGLWESHYRNGQLHTKGHYRKGKREGEWEFYYRNGKLECKGYYKNGNQDGLFQFYYAKGQFDPHRSGTYKNGKKISS
ncbi:hypothetical protein OAN59_03450 [Alphaproteobacteria bacterium]|nr:hypothetical protein [Alphaproteobacteria bacterium]